MKTTAFLIVFTFLAFIANGQNWETNILENVDVTPPTFTGIEGTIDILNMNKTTSLQDYLVKNFEIPEKVKKNRIQGTVIVQFYVLENGNLDYFEIINSISKEIDNELIETLKATNGMWKPGHNDAIPVSMKKEVAIAFTLERFDHTKIAQRHFQKANKKILKGKNKRAIKFFNKAMIYRPYDKSLLFTRGLAHYNVGNQPEACKDWSRLKSLGGDLADIYLNQFCDSDFAINIPLDTEFVTYNFEE